MSTPGYCPDYLCWEASCGCGRFFIKTNTILLDVPLCCTLRRSYAYQMEYSTHKPGPMTAEWGDEGGQPTDRPVNLRSQDATTCPFTLKHAFSTLDNTRVSLV